MLRDVIAQRLRDGSRAISSRSHPQDKQCAGREGGGDGEIRRGILSYARAGYGT